MKNKIEVLIAEDNLISAMLLKDLLEVNNVNVKIAIDGETAYEEAIKKTYDIIFMDFQMPKMNGIDASRKIKSTLNKLEKPETLIIACSASDNPHEKKAWKKVGVDEMLLKPVSSILLNKILRNKGFINIKEKEEVTTKNIKTEKKEILYSLEKLIGMSRGNNEFVARMLHLFVENTPTSISEIESKLLINDFQRVRAILHRIKPSFKMLGMETTTGEIQKIEDLCEQNKQLETIEKLFEPIKKTCYDAIVQIKKEPIYLTKL